MQEHDFEAFCQLLAAEVEIRAKPALSEGAMLLWWDRLQAYSLEQVRDAFRRHGQDAERGRFVPQPADIVAQVDGTASDRTALAWGKVLDAMSSVGGYRDVVFDDPAIHAAVEDMGGWPKMCRTELDNLGYVRHGFMQAHKAYLGRASFDYPRRLSGDRSPDHEYERRGLPVPVPAIVGDMATARLVYRGGAKGGKTPIAGLVGHVAKALALGSSPTVATETRGGQ